MFVFDRELFSAYQIIITIAVVVRNFSYNLLFFNIPSWVVHKLCRLGRGRGGVKNFQFYLVKIRHSGGKGVKNRRFWDDIVAILVYFVWYQGINVRTCWVHIFCSRSKTNFFLVLYNYSQLFSPIGARRSTESRLGLVLFLQFPW